MSNEYGFPICKSGKPIGVHHSHPGGSLNLSAQDIKTGIDKGLKYICVRAGRKVKCHSFPKRLK